MSKTSVQTIPCTSLVQCSISYACYREAELFLRNHNTKGFDEYSVIVVTALEEKARPADEPAVRDKDCDYYIPLSLVKTQLQHAKSVKNVVRGSQAKKNKILLKKYKRLESFPWQLWNGSFTNK